MIFLKADIFDIERGSFVDGPGIRTTAFFKGCNLKCKWCHNPESQSKKTQLMVYKNKCTGCGKCLKVCKHGDNCIFCGECELYCPSDARKICGKQVTVDELFNELIKDIDFFNTSGGGVTFSGGECMLQSDFLCEILKNCKEHGIHTAIDTAGAVAWDKFEKVMPFCDMFLYDIKCITDSLHLQGTGVSNKLILENIMRLSDDFKGDIIIRVPVIPGFNATDDEMRKIADFVNSLNVCAVELLPYHALGENKYPALDMKLTKYTAPSESEMERFKSMFLQI